MPIDIVSQRNSRLDRRIAPRLDAVRSRMNAADIFIPALWSGIGLLSSLLALRLLDVQFADETSFDFLITLLG
jgi:hypothetical protein